jgi:TPR repeat protein
MKDKQMIVWGKKIIPQTLRNKQLAALLAAGAWCSVCCLVEVLNRGAMHHPINAAVTALLFSAPVLIFCAIFLWWLSQAALTSEPLHPPQESEPANAPTESAAERTELVARVQTRGYRWGKFQGRFQLIAGCIAFLIYGAAGNIFGLIAAALGMYCGYGLIKRYRYGAILFFVGAGIAGLAAIGVDAFALIHVFIDPESGGQHLGVGLAYTIIVALWWLVPAIFYYPKRWKEFSVNTSSKTLPQTDSMASVEAVQPGSRIVRSRLTERLRQALKSFSGTPLWFRVSLVVLVVLMIVACGFAVSLPPRTIALRAYVLDTAHHYSLGGILRKLACSRGDGGSCVALAEMYENGEGVAVETPRANELYARAAKLYDSACNQETFDACQELGDLYENGKGVSRDPSKATALDQRIEEHKFQVCNSGNSQVCRELIRDYESKRFGTPDDTKEAMVYAKACELGDQRGCALAGLLYSRGVNLPRDYAKAATFYAKGCDVGDGLSCIELGGFYKLGEGVRQSADRAEEYYVKSCDLGLPDGCADAGFLFAEGRYKPLDFPKALGFWVRACDSSSALGCWGLGAMYRDGKGVQTNIPTAKSYFSKACSLSKDSFYVVGCEELKKFQ